ncbi:MAG: Hsp20/alpha crystallin family protein [Deltaproteobacteria bacterium]|jgi:HSP20 family molecular chaperone IbpA|nr:Hsp20/alpha crystallin family protein [Deltaproteobacteria bacterium]
MSQKGLSINHELETKDREETRSGIIRPVVDIFESEDGLTLLTDLPGVKKEDLHIDVDNGILTIQAKAISYLKGVALRREFIPGNYYRQFHLPNEIDTEKISAEILNGVLIMQMPKAEAAKPRKIEIT